MKFIGQALGEKLVLGPYNKARLNQWIRENQGAKIELRPLSPESKKQRGFYHGGVLTLWVYLDGNDYRDWRILEHYHNEAKKEFNGEIIIRAGKKEKIGKSTKGKLNDGYVERVVEFLEEQYAIDRTIVLDPARFKYFRDKIYTEGFYDTYIDYLVDLNLLPKNFTT